MSADDEYYDQGRVTFHADVKENGSSKLTDDLDADLDQSQIELELQKGEPRAAWGRKIEFLLTIIGYAVGLGNVWRFPYLAQQNGGGAFLIPYTLMLFLEGIPLFYLELAIGQRLRKGSIGVWDEVSPYLGGLGWASVATSYLVGLYYNMIIAWCLFYFFSSFTSKLPWEKCPTTLETISVNETREVPVHECAVSDSTSYFWYRETLDMTENMNETGGLKWKLSLSLLGAWIIIYLCIMKGIKSQGKVVYFTATFPYLVLVIFFVRGVTLPGAGDGLKHMFTPKWERLGDPQVWLDAATQIFYSLGLAFGGLIAYSSYNPPKNNCRRDAISVSLINCSTSLFASLVVFSILGSKAHRLATSCEQRQLAEINELFPNEWNMSTLPPHVYHDRDWTTITNGTVNQTHCEIEHYLDTAAEGTGLAFIIFTEAIVQFPGAPFWSLMFFMMLLTLGIGSQFGMLEGVSTSLCDLAIFEWMKRKELTSAVICVTSFLFGLLFTTGSGQYWLKLFDSYAGSFPLMVIALLEVIGVMYIYGWQKFAADIEYIMGEKPGPYWMIMWRFVSPTLMTVVLVASVIFKFVKPINYSAYSIETATFHKEPYPAGAGVLICVLVLVATGSLPLVAILRKVGIMKYTPVNISVVPIDTSESTARMLRSNESDFSPVDTQIEMLEDGENNKQTE